MITPEEVIKLLDLKPHPKEGGYFAETYKCGEEISKTALPERYGSQRSISTAIYYMLTPDTCSIMHRLKSDEIFHFYLGDPVEMLQIMPDGTGSITTLGHNIVNGMKLQVVVQKGIWQGLKLREGGSFALMGTTVAPGFEYVDYETGNREELVKLCPQYTEMIKILTKS